MKTPYRKTGIRSAGLGACILIGLVLAAGAPAAAQPAGPVLVLTGPRASEMKNVVALAKRGWLAIDGLKVIGVYHVTERTNYASARRWLDLHGPEWIELKALDCALPADAVVGANGCSAEFDRLFAGVDGIIFTGGPDIPPSLYGQPTLFTTVISDPPRHRFEISLLRHLLVGDAKTGRKPLLDKRPAFLVLGLCLGMQTMNVATGGTLWQDIPSQIYKLKSLEAYGRLPADARHRSVSAQLDPGPEVGWGHLHQVRFKPHRLTRSLEPDGKPVTTLSLHHQAIHKLGQGLVVLATSLDGKVIEAVAHRRYPAVFGVQFHPEKRILTDPKLVYRASPGSEPANHIAARMNVDRRALAFHQRFWALVTELLEASNKARLGASAR